MYIKSFVKILKSLKMLLLFYYRNYLDYASEIKKKSSSKKVFKTCLYLDDCFVYQNLNHATFNEIKNIEGRFRARWHKR